MSTIQFYYNASERKVIGKDLTPVNTPTHCTIKGEASVMSPIFIYSSDNAYPSGVNYLYWTEMDRYYFIDDIQVLTGGRMALYCSVDVLESFKDNILNQVAIVDKQQNINESNLYINDGSFINTEQTFNEIKNFQNGFNDNGEFILINAGA